MHSPPTAHINTASSSHVSGIRNGIETLAEATVDFAVSKLGTAVGGLSTRFFGLSVIPLAVCSVLAESGAVKSPGNAGTASWLSRLSLDSPWIVGRIGTVHAGTASESTGIASVPTKTSVPTRYLSEAEARQKTMSQR